MPWTQSEIEREFAELYHVTFPLNSKRIARIGLFSTAASRAESGQTGSTLELRRSRTHVPCGSENVFLNDQVPMIGMLDSTMLPDGMCEWDWVRYLDEHIFFWASKQRLVTFLAARARRNQTKKHFGLYESTVYRVKTRELLNTVGDAAFISMQNSGAPDRQRTQRRRFTQPANQDQTTASDSESWAHWFDTKGKRKPIVEVAVRKYEVPASLLTVMPQEEWKPLVEEAMRKIEARKKK